MIVNVQAGRPLTGQPTMGAQGDMMQCRFGSHGDYNIIALCPASVQEMYELTARAFNLADKYRVPVFPDGGRDRRSYAGEDPCSRFSGADPAKGTRTRGVAGQAEADLIPGFPKFGDGHGVHVTGLTHDERGYPCATNPKLHANLVQRLVDKIESACDRIADYDITNPGAEQVFIAYGAPVRTVQQVMHDYPSTNIGFLGSERYGRSP